MDESRVPSRDGNPVALGVALVIFGSGCADAVVHGAGIAAGLFAVLMVVAVFVYVAD